MSGKATYPRRRYTRRGFLRVAATGVAAATRGSLLTACGDTRLVRKLRVTPAPVRVDEPFAITLQDLSPWQRVLRMLDDVYGVEAFARASRYANEM